MGQDDFCTKCGKRMVHIALPGQAITARCAQCTPVKVRLPAETKAVTAKVVKTYQEMPLVGNDGDTYYVEDMNAVCRYDASVGEDGDWQILSLDSFSWANPIDKYNNRRAAILEQRARKKQ